MAERPRLDRLERALEDLRAGRPVVVLDSADRENEADLIMAAEHATGPWLAFFVRHGSGYVCVPLEAERADRLDLPLMVAENQESMGTAFTVTVDAREGVTTGISATDRSRTVRLLADDATGPRDLARPGHVLPLRARDGGVLVRAGHTEASVDLCRLAGLIPVGVIVELVDQDGSIMAGAAARAFADEHDLPLVSIEQVVAQRSQVEVPDSPVVLLSAVEGAGALAPSGVRRTAR